MYLKERDLWAKEKMRMERIFKLNIRKIGDSKLLTGLSMSHDTADNGKISSNEDHVS